MNQFSSVNILLVNFVICFFSNFTNAWLRCLDDYWRLMLGRFVTIDVFDLTSCSDAFVFLPTWRDSGWWSVRDVQAMFYWFYVSVNWTHFCLLCSGSGLEDLMTAEEKEKLYTAIGYSGSSHNLALPKQVNTPADLLTFLSCPPSGQKI